MNKKLGHMKKARNSEGQEIRFKQMIQLLLDMQYLQCKYVHSPYISQ